MGNTNDTNVLSDAYQTRSFATWFQSDDLSNPTVVWEEWASVNNFAITVWVARNVQFQAADAWCYYLTKFADSLIEAGKPYHIVWIWERGAGATPTKIRLWLNGVEQWTDYEISSTCLNAFPAHSGDISFWNSNDNLKFYNESSQAYIDLDKRLAHFAIWNDKVLTQTEIDSLFNDWADTISQSLTLIDVPNSTKVALVETTGLWWNEVSLADTIKTTTATENVTIDYNVETELSTRLVLYQFDKAIYTTDANLDRFPSSLPYFLWSDPLQSQLTKTVVDAYTSLDTPAQVYDSMKSWKYDNMSLPSYATLPLTKSADTIDAWSYNVILDPSATQNFNFDGTTITIKTANFTWNVQTTWTVTVSTGVTVNGIITDINGTSSFLSLLNIPSDSAVILVNNSGVAVDFVASASSSYSYNIPAWVTGTWTYVVKKAWYWSQKWDFTPTGGTYEYPIAILPVYQPNGSVMYNGTTSWLVDIEFTWTSQLSIDIGDWAVDNQAVFDEVEQSLITQDWMLWLAEGKDGITIANLSAWTFLFLTDDVRFRRNVPTDSSATVNTFVISTQWVFLDPVNGGVQFLSVPEEVNITQANKDEIAALVKTNIEAEGSLLDMIYELLQDIITWLVSIKWDTQKIN